MRTMTLRLDEETYRALDRMADANCRTKTAEIRWLIRQKALNSGHFKPEKPKLVSPDPFPVPARHRR